MAELRFENLEFTENKVNKENINAALLKIFEFTIPKDALRKIGQFRISKKKKNSIEFIDVPEKQASAKFSLLIADGISRLRNRLNSKPAVYIHRNSGIPLIGSLFFGIVDRGTTIIEVKPLTGCNMNCIFCSVDEGISSKKETDFIVEEEYLAEEVQRLLDFKKSKGIEVFINPHGEPLLYADIVRLVRDLKSMQGISRVCIATNSTLLTEKLIDELAEAGLDQFSISVHSFDEKRSKMIAGTADYDISRVRKMIDYILSKGIKAVLAPVWVPGINDKDVKEIAGFCRDNGCEAGIQKYISHKKGRKPRGAEEMDWPEFFKELEKMQEEQGHNLVYQCGPAKTPELPKPFRTGEIIRARIACNGRHEKERIAVSGSRAITVYGCEKPVGDTVKIRIIKSKNNIYHARLS